MLSHLILCDSVDYNPPGSSVHRILQARILEWVAISFSRGSSPPRDQTQVSCIIGKFLTTEPPGKPLNWDLKDKQGLTRKGRASKGRNPIMCRMARPKVLRLVHLGAVWFWQRPAWPQYKRQGPPRLAGATCLTDHIKGFCLISKATGTK